jgi:hypothetical protein
MSQAINYFKCIFFYHLLLVHETIGQLHINRKDSFSRQDADHHGLLISCWNPLYRIWRINLSSNRHIPSAKLAISSLSCVRVGFFVSLAAVGSQVLPSLVFPSARAAEFPVYSSSIDLLCSVVAQTRYQANWKVGPVQVLRNKVAVRLQSLKWTREADGSTLQKISIKVSNSHDWEGVVLHFKSGAFFLELYTP